MALGYANLARLIADMNRDLLYPISPSVIYLWAAGKSKPRPRTWAHVITWIKRQRLRDDWRKRVPKPKPIGGKAARA